MKSWREQAEKNGLTIIEEGNCQLCNARTKKGLIECVDKSSMIIHKLDHDLGIKNMTIFLCVDAHALQHGEIHGRWNNHFHLTRLNLILNRKVQWNYKLSPVLSRILDAYKLAHKGEIIGNPKCHERGRISVVDLEKVKSDIDYIDIVNQWAFEVYNKFVSGHKF
jgi:hypothetical protein